MDKPGTQRQVGLFIVALSLIAAVLVLFSFWLDPELNIRLVGRVSLILSMFLQGIATTLRGEHERRATILTYVAGLLVLLSLATWFLPDFE